MYIPEEFAETRREILHDLIRAHSFATLVSNGAEGPVASHVPVVFLPASGAFGTVQFHLARQNAHADALAAGEQSLAIFQGPHAYISPRWYVSPVTVPTWNYAVVHAYGHARAMHDAQLADHLRRLAEAYEPADGGWTPDRIPQDAFAGLRRAIVGFEIEIKRLEGKWKIGQNRRAEDVRGAIDGLLQTGDPDAVRVAQMMKTALEAKQAE
jgi:transcriptional regulator